MAISSRTSLSAVEHVEVDLLVWLSRLASTVAPRSLSHLHASKPRKKLLVVSLVLGDCWLTQSGFDVLMEVKAEKKARHPSIRRQPSWCRLV